MAVQQIQVLLLKQPLARALGDLFRHNFSVAIQAFQRHGAQEQAASSPIPLTPR